MSTPASTTAVPAAPRLRALNDNHFLVPYLYLLPHALFFLAFTVYPIGFGIYISVHRWDPLAATQPYVGLEFYRNLFLDTPQRDFFWRTLLNTFLFAAISVPLLVATALGLAQLLYRPILFRAIFRSVFFMPGILSVSVMGILWKWLFDNQSGLVNIVLGMLGKAPIAFLTTDGWAWVPVTLGTVWWTIGFNMTLYLAAMGNIPASLYEAAELDGANGWHKFRFITFPLLQSTTLFVVVTTVLASLQLFGQTQIITGGGPARATQSVIQYITEEAFGNNQFSSATAMSFVFGVIMLVFTAIQFRGMARDARGSDK